MTPELQKKVDYSVNLVRRAEKLALSMWDKGFYLAFSGGKDSLCLYHIAKMAGVKFEAHYNLTTLDPPELVYFIREHYPDVVVNRPKLSFFQLCLKKKMLPRSMVRFCCAELKETKGAGTCTLIGIRHAESSRRAKRQEVGLGSRKFSGTLDQFEKHRETEHSCIKGKDKVIISPIIDWTDEDVWQFIRSQGISYCKLYDEGWKRIGCLFCPMASKSEMKRMKDRYPRYYALFVRIIGKLRAEAGYMNSYKFLTDEEIMEWYMSKKTLRKFLAEQKQLKIDL